MTTPQLGAHPRWYTAVESGACPRCRRDLFAREVDIKALTVACWCGAIVSIELFGIAVRSVRIVDRRSMGALGTRTARIAGDGRGDGIPA